MSVNVRAAIENQLEMIRDFENDEHTLDTPYTTFHHRDMHMKNILVKRGMSIGCILFVADTFLYAICHSLLGAFIRIISYFLCLLLYILTIVYLSILKYCID